MASQCGKCDGEILNSDFIKCNGMCAVKYHAKCVALNRTTLNAITSCANIYWFCHSCNDKKNDPNLSATNIKEDMNMMMKSLSECLLNGFAMMTEKIVDNISSRMTQPINSVNHSTENSNKRRRADVDDDNTIQLVARKKFIFGTNDKNSSLAVDNFLQRNDCSHSSSSQPREPRKSIVVSNISKSILAEHIVDYLADELKITKDSIRVTPLAPAGKNLNDLTYMQYRVSTPASIYSRLISANTWPKGVRVRDFLHTKRNDMVTLDNFLVKNASDSPPDTILPDVQMSPVKDVPSSLNRSTESPCINQVNASTVV